MADLNISPELSRAVMNPEGVGGNRLLTFNYGAMAMAQVGSIRTALVFCASQRFPVCELERCEAGLQCLHTFTMPYHYDEYLLAYRKIMMMLSKMNPRDKRVRKSYHALLLTWFGALLKQLKMMGLLMERSGIVEFESTATGTKGKDVKLMDGGLIDGGIAPEG